MLPHEARVAGIPGGEAATEGPTGTPVTSIRVLYPDLHGVARGKDVPIAEFDYVLDKGLRFCAAVMGTDLRHTPVVGGDEGYPDLIARPDMATMTPLPWEPGVATCMADLEPAEGGAPIPDPRGNLRRAVEDLRAIGFDPIIGASHAPDRLLRGLLAFTDEDVHAGRLRLEEDCEQLA